jgi:hypothetical protein
MAEFLKKIGLDTVTKKAIAATALAGAAIYVGYRYATPSR